MTETIYIYCTDAYGDLGPYLATFRELESNLPLAAALGGFDPPELSERTWAIDRPPVVVDERGTIVAEAASLDTLEKWRVRPDGALFWEVLARELLETVQKFLEKRVTYRGLRRVVAQVEGLIEEN